MTKEKLLFFDIDGTLVGFDGIIPDSTWKALDLARENGHLLFICTGRSRHQIHQVLLDYGFDGIVASAGGYVEYKNQALFHQHFGKERMKSVVDCFKGTGTGLILEMKEACVSSASSEKQFLTLFQLAVDTTDLKELVAFSKLINDEDFLSYPDKYADTDSIIYCNSPFDTEEVRRRLSGDIHVELASFTDPEPYSGEITMAGITKQTGIQRVLEFLGKAREDVIGFGDGANDIQMLDYAGTAVVMGTAEEEIRKHADYVTDPVYEDGLYNAMKYLGLIG